MSHYNLKLSENPSFSEVCKFSQEYVDFINNVEDDEEIMVLSGTRLKHIEKIREFIFELTNIRLSLMGVVELIYRFSEPMKTDDESYCRSFIISEARVLMYKAA